MKNFMAHSIKAVLVVGDGKNVQVRVFLDVRECMMTDQ